jgi:hypothetical protein
MTRGFEILRLAPGLALLGVALMVSAAGKSVALGSLGYGVQVPDAWVQEQPTNTMRLAQFQIPAKGQEPASVIAYYFGQGSGGSIEANVQRWQSQFTTADGKPVKAAQRKAKAGAFPVTWVELNGNYARGVGMGPQGTVLPNQTLLAAIVETPKGNVTFHLYGPKASVAQNRKAYEGMVNSIK